ncbi:MAG: hypothetical protein WBA37_15710 [Xanthobacteraceae bacterium]
MIEPTGEVGRRIAAQEQLYQEAGHGTKLFNNGEHMRDSIYIDDIAKPNPA